MTKWGMTIVAAGLSMMVSVPEAQATKEKLTALKHSKVAALKSAKLTGGFSYSSKHFGKKGWGKKPIGGSSSGSSGSTGGWSSTGGSGGHSSSGGPTPVPEPGMFGLMGLGLGALAVRRVRRRRA